jgi:peptidoglycan hydrolase-like protein with peptidoglycan-binding domain
MYRVVLVTCGIVSMPTAAWAQSPAPAPTTATAPVSATIQLKLQRPTAARNTVLAGDDWRVRGVVTPYIAGQSVIVRLYHGRERLRLVHAHVRSGPSGAGRFVAHFISRRAAVVTVRVTHRATPVMATAIAQPVRVDVIDGSLQPGARGRSVRVLQQRLRARGYGVGRRGVLDAKTLRAVTAFRKVVGISRQGGAGPDVLRRVLRGAGSFRVRFPRHGRHVEADLSRQVLALIDHRRVLRIYGTSSGAPATPTIRGSFRFYSKQAGTNARGMFDSSYFIGGYAIHGYASVPVFPASHGCLRVGLADAPGIFRWVQLGDRIDVYV